jgi:hypothetical protein
MNILNVFHHVSDVTLFCVVIIRNTVKPVLNGFSGPEHPSAEARFPFNQGITVIIKPGHARI